ncbi:nuclear transport factor 2 [Rosa sericea]
MPVPSSARLCLKSSPKIPFDSTLRSLPSCMALQQLDSSSCAQLVGNAFVESYYHFLRHAPEDMYKFYQDSSASCNGNMTTLDAIKSINDECHKCEIESVDAQESPQKGVTVLVTGYLVGKDNVGRKFAQTFILAPQEKGYFIFKDMFRYIKDNESSQTNIIDEQDFEQGLVIQSSQSKDLADTTPEVQEDALKKSYASVVVESSVASSPVHATQVRRTISAITGHPSLGYANPSLVPEASAPGDDASFGKEQYS